MAGLLAGGAVSAQALIVTFDAPAQLHSLEHNRAYVWGIGWDPAGETIISAELVYHDIYDWRPEVDYLHSRLVDINPGQTGLHSFYDGGGNNDYFAAFGTPIGVWSDPVGGGPGVDVSYTFDQTLLDALNDYASDAAFGIAIDPDCHYYNDGITLELETVPEVPEPSVVILLGAGLAGAGLYRRLRRRS
jgi:hypothetical protein